MFVCVHQTGNEVQKTENCDVRVFFFAACQLHENVIGAKVELHGAVVVVKDN